MLCLETECREKVVKDCGRLWYVLDFPLVLLFSRKETRFELTERCCPNLGPDDEIGFHHFTCRGRTDEKIVTSKVRNLS